MTTILYLIPLMSGVSQVKKDRFFLKKLEYANYEFENENYHTALPLFIELYSIDSSDLEITYKLGVCLFYVRKESLEAIKFFEKTKNFFPNSYYYLGRLYHLEQNFEKAIDYYNKALMYRKLGENVTFDEEEINFFKEKSLIAKEIISKPTNAFIWNLTDINTVYAEYAPVVSNDQKLIFFTSRRKGSTGNKLDFYLEYYEDIYLAKKNDSAGKYDIINVGETINTNLHDATLYLSPNSDTLYFFRTSPSLVSGNVYFTIIRNGELSVPQKVDINFGKGTVYSLCFSSDGETIYYSSDMEGGFGGKDIWRITKLPNNQWSLPYNLGPLINTPYDEDSPFISSDGKTLYFSSKGHKNIGGYDIFKSNLDEMGKWGKPINLGYPINSVYDDIHFQILSDNKSFYFASNRAESIGNQDIYKGMFFDPFKDYIIFKGIVLSEDLQPLQATITVIDIKTKEIQGTYRSNKKGNFITVFYPNKTYKIIVESEGYLPYFTTIEIGTEDNENLNTIEKIILKK